MHGLDILCRRMSIVGCALHDAQQDEWSSGQSSEVSVLLEHSLSYQGIILLSRLFAFLKATDTT